MSFTDALTRTERAGTGERVQVATWPGVVALVLAACSFISLVAPGGTLTYALGYALGAVGVPVVAVIHRYSYESRQKSPWFVRARRPGQVIMAALVMGLSGGMANAWFLATELAKQ